ncbi:MAG: cytochrome c biogenesis protein DipZ [Cellulomonas sp.]
MDLLTLALIGLVGGLITGISPCILPVLPVIFFSGGVQSARTTTRSPTTVTPGPVGAGAAGVGALRQPKFGAANRAGPPTAVLDRPQPPQGGGRAAGRASSGRAEALRPYLVIAGLVTSFTAFTLLGSVLLAVLHLPQDLLRWAGIAVLAVLGLGLLFPRFEEILERPFARFAPRTNKNANRSGFLLGLGLGAVYVPCAGPVLAAITVAGATGEIGLGTVVLTVSFALGAAIPLLVFALAGRRVAERVKAFRTHQRGIRATGGLLMIALAFALAFNVTDALQRALPGYTDSLQGRIAANETVQRQLDLGGLVTAENEQLSKCTNNATELEDCGPAPAIRGTDAWLNTDGGAAIDLADLRGQVVLIDFWAYSCINCQRSVPHVTAWDAAYRDAGLQVIGVHTPEYAFERELRNVADGADRLGIEYPIAQDNAYSTWTAYRNRYWPAHYLIDADGVVRHISQGEGGYETTERLIRQLLGEANPDAVLPAPTAVADSTPRGDGQTPETFLSVGKRFNYADDGYTEGPATYDLPADQPADTFAFGGAWTTDYQAATAGADARVRLTFTASDVFMVLGGEGTVHAVARDADGRVVEERDVVVTGSPTLYPLLDGDTPLTGTVEVQVPVGMAAYSFTFG